MIIKVDKIFQMLRYNSVWTVTVMISAATLFSPFHNEAIHLTIMTMNQRKEALSCWRIDVHD